jgi:hypothetical protein
MDELVTQGFERLSILKHILSEAEYWLPDGEVIAECYEKSPDYDYLVEEEGMELGDPEALREDLGLLLQELVGYLPG